MQRGRQAAKRRRVGSKADAEMGLSHQRLPAPLPLCRGGSRFSIECESASSASHLLSGWASSLVRSCHEMGLRSPTDGPRRQGATSPQRPLSTYRWEELRRSKARGGYPWTYLEEWRDGKWVKSVLWTAAFFLLCLLAIFANNTHRRTHGNDLPAWHWAASQKTSSHLECWH
jgi:hypothetical protein